MTSPWRTQNSAGDVTGSDPRSSTSVTRDSTQPFSTFYDDSLRPKSFLHDEVDEFNRVLAELLQSRQRPQPTSEEPEDWRMCSSSWSDDAFRVTQPPELPRTNNHVVYDSKTQSDSRLGSQSLVTHWTNDRCDEEEEEGDETVDDDDDVGDNVLEIVEEDEDDHRLSTKDCSSSQLSRYVFTDDLFHEVSREHLNIIIITYYYYFGYYTASCRMGPRA